MSTDPSLPRGAAARGGRQPIPRPPGVRPGPPPAWLQLSVPDRRFGLDDVLQAVEALPPPSPSPWELPNASRSAVLICVYELDGEAHLILTKRPDTMRSHSGEIAFPGGKFDAGADVSLAATACREAEEEIGLDPAFVTVVGELNGIATFVSGFIISPFVGVLDRAPTLRLQPEEVVAAFEVPISELLATGTYRSELWDITGAPGVPDMVDRQMHFYDLVGETVWGATGRILTDFLDSLVAFRRATA